MFAECFQADNSFTESLCFRGFLEAVELCGRMSDTHEKVEYGRIYSWKFGRNFANKLVSLRILLSRVK